MELGYRIKLLLDLHNKGALDLATHCQVSHTTAYNWLDGTEPRPARKRAIAAFFNVTVQDLEYAPILSLSSIIRNGKSGARTTLDQAMTEQAADMMIFQELNTCGPKSKEYQTGMRDYVICRLLGTPMPNRFKAGSTQADAYGAGSSHAENLMNRS